MVVEEVRMRLRRKLEKLVGVSEAEILLDRPPGGWGDLVTNHTLDLRFAASEARMDAKLAELEIRMERSLRDQTMTVIGTTVALSRAIIAAIRW